VRRRRSAPVAKAEAAMAKAEAAMAVASTEAVAKVVAMAEAAMVAATAAAIEAMDVIDIWKRKIREFPESVGDETIHGWKWVVTTLRPTAT
jgi:hypothetical protein